MAINCCPSAVALTDYRQYDGITDDTDQFPSVSITEYRQRDVGSTNMPLVGHCAP